jgi:DNA-binding NtrC family response regulator
MRSVLIVEDNKETQRLISNLLKDNKYKTYLVSDGNEVINKFNQCKPDIVLLDIALPGLDGISILKQLKKIDEDIIVIMISGLSGVRNVVTSIKFGAYDYLKKPFDTEELLIIIEKSLEKRKLTREVKTLRKRLNLQDKKEMVMGNSPMILRILQQVELVAPTNMSVIIQGESGTGKEVIARKIHKKSLRKNKPFIAIDCGAIPDTLIESEMFGYEKGAFTGAFTSKLGKFVEANGGTLLLDEITNLPILGQAKLLRVLEEKHINPIGGKVPIPVDVRIIATSNLDLEEEVNKGNFRNDLFHRLNEFQIILPRLSERKEDIPILAKKFLNETEKELKKKIKGFTAESMLLLLNYSWPGNVREMKHVIKRAVLIADEEYVTVGKLSIYAEKSSKNIEIIEITEEPSSLDEMIRKLERYTITKAIEESKGNKTKASKKLGINIRTLHRKLKNEL